MTGPQPYKKPSPGIVTRRKPKVHKKVISKPACPTQQSKRYTFVLPIELYAQLCVETTLNKETANAFVERVLREALKLTPLEKPKSEVETFVSKMHQYDWTNALNEKEK